MNHRDHNTNNPCLPVEAYPALARAIAARSMNRKPCSVFRKIVRRLAAFLPVLFLAATLPAETPQEMEARTETLVWRQPKQAAPKPQPLPRIAL